MCCHYQHRLPKSQRTAQELVPVYACAFPNLCEQNDNSLLFASVNVTFLKTTESFERRQTQQLSVLVLIICCHHSLGASLGLRAHCKPPSQAKNGLDGTELGQTLLSFWNVFGSPPFSGCAVITSSHVANLCAIPE